MKRISICLLSPFIFVSLANGACTASVNKNKPRGFPGGQFNDCRLQEQGQPYCNPTKGQENYMSRHHIFDKHAWIDVLNKGLNSPNVESDQAEHNIDQMLKAEGAPQVVIDNFNQDGVQCTRRTNSWLTWLPVNLALGPAPQNRAFDPANHFDSWALLSVPEAYQTLFTNIRYASDNQVIADNLAKMPNDLKAPWPMKLGSNANWVRAKEQGHSGQLAYCPKQVFQSFNQKSAGPDVCPDFAYTSIQ